MGCIYRILCIENQKSYIGQSIRNDPKSRYSRHWNDAINRNEDTPLYRAFRKYGKDCFILETLCVVSKDSLDNMECYYAEQYDSYIWNNGYNAVLCGKGCRPSQIHTDEFRLKMSNRMRGRKMSEETKEKIRSAKLGTTCKWSDETRNRIIEECRIRSTGKHHSEETKKKIGLARALIPGPNKGVKMKEETKEKLRIARTGIPHTEETKQRMSETHKQRYKDNPESTRRKFTDEQVRYIRSNPDKLSQKQLAQEFNVCFQSISSIQRREIYKYVK